MPPIAVAELRRLVETGWGARDGRPVSVGIVERRPFEHVTSYEFERLRVRIGDAEPLDLVVKDFGAHRLPKDDLGQRAEREATVYRELLDGAGVGTPRLFGVAYHPVRLVLEYVDGANLKHHGLETWLEAATWLGTFQARLAERSQDVPRPAVLIRHDRAFFLSRVHAAATAVTAFGARAERRLGAILDGYVRFVETMVDQPRTLVHGSFRPQNIIVSRAADGALRICPVDWELAGLGSPLYDLAFLAEGFHGAELARFFEAYFRGAGHAGGSPDGETTFALDCFRLHKILKSLGDAVALAFRPATVDKLLAMGEETRGRLA